MDACRIPFIDEFDVIGAFDVLAKPHGSYSFGDLGPQLIARIKASTGAKIRAIRPDSAAKPALRPAPAPILAARAPAKPPALPPAFRPAAGHGGSRGRRYL